MELQDATVLVTGATGNIDPYVTDALVNRGATVIGTSVAETERTEAEEHGDQSGAVSYHQVDLTDQPAVEAVTETVHEEYGSVDHVVGPHLLANEGVTGQVIRTTGGQSEKDI